jgi:hypothetical protein
MAFQITVLEEIMKRLNVMAGSHYSHPVSHKDVVVQDGYRVPERVTTRGFVPSGRKAQQSRLYVGRTNLDEIIHEVDMEIHAQFQKLPFNNAALITEKENV